jgi:CheY-like chemotaxis protein
MINKKIIALTFPSLKVSSYMHAGVALDRLKQWAESEPSQLPDFIFLDINMPELDGWEFLDEFMKLPAAVQEKVQVIMLTSSIDISDIAKSRTYKPVIDFLSKPLNADRLNTLMVSHRKM